LDSRSDRRRIEELELNIVIATGRIRSVIELRLISERGGLRPNAAQAEKANRQTNRKSY
jgi:hypothetical protein